VTGPPTQPGYLKALALQPPNPCLTQQLRVQVRTARHAERVYSETRETSSSMRPAAEIAEIVGTGRKSRTGF
jgi:hypothetical protein